MGLQNVGRYRQVVVIRRWSSFGGGRYSEVAVSSGLTVHVLAPVTSFEAEQKFRRVCDKGQKKIRKRIQRANNF